MVLIFKSYITTKSNSIKSFDWSPDGKKIILSISKNDVSDLFIINLDDNDIQQITQAKEGEEYLTPKWIKLSK